MKTTLTVILIIHLYGLTFCVIEQHYFINLEKTWDDAQQYCENYFHDLSTFASETEEQQFLEDADAQTSDAWVGLWYDEQLNRTWLGYEITALIEVYIPDIPDLNTSDICPLFHKDLRQLNDETCSNSHAFFCMRVFEIVVVQQTETWETALDNCRDNYDDLASLSSNTIMDYALNLTTDAETQYVWIGLRFLAGQWFWVNGDDLKYKAWSEARQPQCPATNQRCGALDINTKTWTFRDCQEKLNFLCLTTEPNNDTSIA